MRLASLGEIAAAIRSKNAGPFTLTIDVFCGEREIFDRVRIGLSNEDIARLFDRDPGQIRRFEIPNLCVVKFSFPRPVIQGDRFDRDIHGAQYAELLRELPLPDGH